LDEERKEEKKKQQHQQQIYLNTLILQLSTILWSFLDAFFLGYIIYIFALLVIVWISFLIELSQTVNR
jgi:hypothetical protein